MSARKMIPVEVMTPETKCGFCTNTQCCTYISQEIDVPRSKQDFDFLLGLLEAIGIDGGLDPAQRARHDEQVDHDVRQPLGSELFADDVLAVLAQYPVSRLRQVACLFLENIHLRPDGVIQTRQFS